MCKRCHLRCLNKYVDSKIFSVETQISEGQSSYLQTQSANKVYLNDDLKNTIEKTLL